MNADEVRHQIMINYIILPLALFAAYGDSGVLLRDDDGDDATGFLKIIKYKN